MAFEPKQTDMRLWCTKTAPGKRDGAHHIVISIGGKGDEWPDEVSRPCPVADCDGIVWINPEPRPPE